MSRTPESNDAALLEFEHALTSLAEALRECERLLSTVELPEAVVHDETFQRLLWLLRVEQDDGSGGVAAGAGEDGRPPLLH